MSIDSSEIKKTIDHWNDRRGGDTKTPKCWFCQKRTDDFTVHDKNGRTGGFVVCNECAKEMGL